MEVKPEIGQVPVYVCQEYLLLSQMRVERSRMKKELIVYLLWITTIVFGVLYGRNIAMGTYTHLPLNRCAVPSVASRNIFVSCTHADHLLTLVMIFMCVTFSFRRVRPVLHDETEFC